MSGRRAKTRKSRMKKRLPLIFCEFKWAGGGVYAANASRSGAAADQRGAGSGAPPAVGNTSGAATARDSSERLAAYRPLEDT